MMMQVFSAMRCHGSPNRSTSLLGTAGLPLDVRIVNYGGIGPALQVLERDVDMLSSM